MMTPDEIIAVVQASKEGKTLQGFSDNYWSDCIDLEHALRRIADDWIIRVKPEPPKPREWVAAIYAAPEFIPGLYASEAAARSCHTHPDLTYKLIRVREVLPKDAP